MISYLVGGRPTPLKNMKVSWDDEIPNIWKNKKCSKPPTRFYSRSYIYISILTGGSSYLLLLVEWEPTVHKPVRNGHQFFQICCVRAKPMCPLLKQVIRPFSPYTALSLKFTWLVVYLPSWNIWVRQWEGWHPIYEMENNPNVWNHQPVTYFLDEIKNFSNNAHVHWCKHGFVWKYMKILWCVKQK